VSDLSFRPGEDRRSIQCRGRRGTPKSQGARANSSLLGEKEKQYVSYALGEKNGDGTGKGIGLGVFSSAEEGHAVR